MKLTDHQQKMLDGAFGKGKAMAMQIQIGVGKCFDAERLFPSAARTYPSARRRPTSGLWASSWTRGLPAPSRRQLIPVTLSTISVIA